MSTSGRPLACDAAMIAPALVPTITSTGAFGASRDLEHA
jgi:hypothetical protein